MIPILVMLPDILIHSKMNSIFTINCQSENGFAYSKNCKCLLLLKGAVVCSPCACSQGICIENEDVLVCCQKIGKCNLVLTLVTLDQ